MTARLRRWRRGKMAAVAVAVAACAPSSRAPAPGSAAPSGTATAITGPVTPAQLRQAIDSMVALPKFSNAHWGVLIVDPEHGDTLYSHNAGKLFMPASNQKILTGAVALEQLGPDHRFATSLVATGPVEGGVLRGDLAVIGGGDPTASVRMRGDALAPLRELADSLAAHDVRYVTGRLTRVGDAFPDANHGFGWAWDDFAYDYSAGVDELMLNEGFVRVTVRAGRRPGARATATMVPDIGYPALRVSAVTVQRPDTLPCCDTTSVARRPEPRELTAEHDSSSSSGVIIDGEIAVGDSAVLDVAYRDAATAFMLALRKALAERAITIEGGVDPRVRRDTGQRLDTILTLRSPPLREILPAFQKPSQNQIGEILYKTLGLVRTGVGTADSGRVVVERQLAAWGIDSSMFAVRDGSGLSRHDYVSPEALVRVLDVMRRHPSFAVFYDALPVAGVDGTIARRMRGTAAAGNVRAKTGTLDKARSLSGYVRTDDGRMLIFSLLCNNFTTPVADVTEVQDAIAMRLALLRGRR